MVNRTAQELDRWENEGGALRAEHQRFLVGLTETEAGALKNLDAAGGHREAHAKDDGEAMKLLVRRHFVKRSAYKAGLVTYEITNAGREFVRDLQS